MSARSEMSKIYKITVGIGISMLITQLLGFGRDVTAPMALIVVMALSPALHSTRNNARSVLISNFIGIVLGIILPLFINNYPLAVTLAVFITLVVAYKLPWYTSFITSAITTMLVIYIGTDIEPMRYGLDRIVLVIMGVVVGYIINNMFFPANYGDIVHRSIKETSHNIFKALDDIFKGQSWLKDSKRTLLEIETQIEEINQDFDIFSKDLLLNKKYLREYKDKQKSYESMVILLKVSYYVIYKFYSFHDIFISLPEDVKEKIISSLEELVELHKKLLNCFYKERYNDIINFELDENINLSYNYNEMAFKGSIAEYSLELNKFKKTILCNSKVSKMI